MKTKKAKTQKFLVLVPHRDIRVELQRDCDLTLKAGLAGVYKFPLVAPLASLSREAEDGELKQIAISLRETAGKNKITSQEDAVIDFPCYEKKLTLCGPRLDIVTHQDLFKNVNKKIKYIFPSFVTGCFLMPDFNHDSGEDGKKFNAMRETPRKQLGFRAAAAANMYWRTLRVNGEIYFKWKIGKLFWLPRP